MTSQATSIAKRLYQAGSPDHVRDWEKKDGYFIAACRISKDDVPYLIDIASKWSDPDWPSGDLELDPDLADVELLPITAWRALADLKSSESVEPLIGMLCELEDECDDWVSSELPHVFGKIGKPAVGAIAQLANDTDKPDFVRSIAAESLQRVAEYHTETRGEIVALLADMMTNAADSSIKFNSTLLVGLVDLHAIEAAEAIERAFANDHIDVGMIGDWQTVRRKLGVEGLGLEMPKHPHNSLERLRRNMGIGIFSDQPIFSVGGVVPDAEQDYYDRASQLFSKSTEAQQVVDRFGDLRWFRMLLDFGLNDRGEAIDQITLGGVEQFVLEYIPRKVSIGPEQAAAIVFELTMFWEYLRRVYELPAAESIIGWLKMNGMAARLEAAPSNPENFGIAKTMFMSGTDAGYDMTSEKGAAEFIAAYNRSVRSKIEPSPAKPVSGGKKIGRNDPCPCGSGMKFKKCCG